MNTVLFILGLYIAVTGLIPCHKTRPKQRWYFNTIDWTLRPVMRIFFRNKLTHGYHWIAWHDDINTSITVKCDGDSEAPKIKGVWSQIKAEWKGWHKVAVMRLSLLPSYFDKIIYSPKFWQIGFENLTTKEKKLCTFKIEGFDSPIMCYIGHDDVRFFAIGPDGKQLPLVFFYHKYVERDDPTFKKLPLL